ncbi:YncE family protein [Streptomyces sp. NPDC056002]|uniref:YncE family protein n=1 Tax=Streptomyces sp. NPDC056002 TaxID=3345675 RepID=UPI0035E38F07
MTAALMGQESLAGASAGTSAAGLSSRPGALVYIANLHSDTVSVVDTGIGRVVGSVPVGDGPDSVAVSPDGSRVYVTNFVSDTVSVIDARTRTVIATVAVGDEPSTVTVSADNQNVYVANVGSDNVSMISTRTRAVTDTIAVGDVPLGVAVTPDGCTLYATRALTALDRDEQGGRRGGPDLGLAAGQNPIGRG